MTLAKEEFHAFLLVYIEKADFFEQVEERDYILKKVSQESFEKASHLFDHLSDSERSNLIIDHKNLFSREERDAIFKELRELMQTADGTEAAEIAVFTGLHRLLV